jgi:2-hydroxy-4-carboxymuconate semialdehyde hemiacetal dehydrogenase
MQQGPLSQTFGIALDMNFGMKRANWAPCIWSLSFKNEAPLGTFFRHIYDNGTYICRYVDLFDGQAVADHERRRPDRRRHSDL